MPKQNRQPTQSRFTIRARAEDLNRLATIATALRVSGALPFATKTDALRHALAVVASAVSGPVPTDSAPR